MHPHTFLPPKALRWTAAILLLSIASGTCAARGDDGPTTKNVPRDPRLATLAPTQNYRVMGRGDWLLSYNGQTKCPAWTLERLDVESLAVNVTRKDSFRGDELLPRYLRVTPANYLNTLRDMGHCACAANHRFSADEMRETFLLSNMMPQYPTVNRVVINHLEAALQTLVGEGVVVWVATGPAWMPQAAGKLSVKTIGPAGVWEPTHVVKAILIERKHDGRDDLERECQAWVIDNVPNPDPSYDHYRRPTLVAQEAVGLDLWADLPDDEEARLEAQ